MATPELEAIAESLVSRDDGKGLEVDWKGLKGLEGKMSSADCWSIKDELFGMLEANHVLTYELVGGFIIEGEGILLNPKRSEMGSLLYFVRERDARAYVNAVLCDYSFPINLSKGVESCINRD